MEKINIQFHALKNIRNLLQTAANDRAERALQIKCKIYQKYPLFTGFTPIIQENYNLLNLHFKQNGGFVLTQAKPTDRLSLFFTLLLFDDRAVLGWEATANQ